MERKGNQNNTSIKEFRKQGLRDLQKNKMKGGERVVRSNPDSELD